MFNVRDFGAAGDGATDDTQAVQSAVDFAHLVARTVDQEQRIARLEGLVQGLQQAFDSHTHGFRQDGYWGDSETSGPITERCPQCGNGIDNYGRNGVNVCGSHPSHTWPIAAAKENGHE